MTTKNRRRAALTLAIAALAATTTVTLGANAAAGDARCRPVAGKLEERQVDAPPGVFAAEGRLTGGIQGTDRFTMRFDDLSDPIPGTTVSQFVGRSVIETRTGEIDTIVVGAFDTQSGRFSDLFTIVGGTGDWDGATGQLHLYGVFDLGSGTGTSDYRGEVCT